MKKYSKILLATDYSDAVMNAERYAVQYAKSTKSTLTLLHVYQIPVSSPNEPLEYSRNPADVRNDELKRLEQHRDKLFQSLNINSKDLECECLVREGIAGKQICKEAKESNFDLVFVGTHGETGFRDLIFGSHTWNVIKKSPVPVLVIPKEASYRGIKKIVFGTEYREGEVAILNFLTRFAADHDAELVTLHVTNYVLTKQFEKSMFEKFRNDIQKEISYKKLKVKLLKNENVLEGLNEYCEHEKADLLVMSPEKQFLFEKIFLASLSITRKMSVHSAIPLMTIPDFYNPEYIAFWKFFSQADKVNEDL